MSEQRPASDSALTPAERGRLRRIGWVAFGLAMVLLYAVPSLVSQPFILHVLILSFVFAVPAIGLNLMLGYTGLISLGHMAFAGIGGYTAAVLMVDAGFSFWWALPAGTLAAGVMGAVIGIICLQLRSHFFIIVTLAAGLIFFSIFNNWDDVTRGAEGFAGIPRPAPMAFLGADFRFLGSFYYLALTILIVIFLVQTLVARSDFGRALKAIRQDERLAVMRGINAMAYKVTVFAIGSAIAGTGGVMLVTFLRVGAPLSFDMLESINVVLMVIIGGAGTLWGPIVGAMIFIGLPEYLRVAEELRLIFFGVLILVMTLTFRGGIAGLIERGVGAAIRGLRR